MPLQGSPNVTLIAALTPDGRGTLLSVDGAVGGAVCAACLDQIPGSTLRPGDVVMRDNESVHQVSALDESMRKYGGTCILFRLTQLILN